MAKSIKVVLELDDKQFNKGIKSATTNVDNFDKEATSASSGVGLLAVGLAGAATAALGLASAVNAARSVEDLGITLETLYGDANLAAEALATVKEQAALLPVALDEIQRGVPSLALVGDAMGGLAESIQFTSGIASAFGMTFDEAAVQVQRALTSGINSAEMFKDRGVAAFLGFEQGATVTAEETKEAFLKNFDKITAANAKAADSMTGKFSMVGDAIFQVQEAIGTAFSSELKEVTDQFLGAFAQNKDDILATAKAIGENLGTALGFLVDNMNIIIPLITAFAAGWAAMKFVAIAQGIMGIRVAVLALNTAILANPIGAIASAIAFAAVLIVTYWDDIKAAAVSASLEAEIGFKKLELFLYQALGPAIGSIVDSFSDLKNVAVAVGAGIVAAMKDPFDATEAFKTTFAATMKSMESDSSSAVEAFAVKARQATGELGDLEQAALDNAAALDDNTSAADAAADAQQSISEVVDEAAKAIEIQTSQWDELNNSIGEATKEIKAVDGAYQAYIADLEMDIQLSGESNEERERQIELNKAYKAAAKELGVTLAELSQETKDQIEEQVSALVTLKQTKEEEVEAAIEGEEMKQKSLDRTLERIEDNMAALSSASENAVDRMKEEHQYMQDTIDLYGVEKDVAEDLHEYDKKIHGIETKLEQDIQALRDAGHTVEANNMQKKLDTVKENNEEERAELEKTATAQAEYQRSFEYGWRTSYAKFMDESANAAKLGQDVFETMAYGMTDALEGFILTGKFEFKDLLNDMKKTIARFLAEAAIKKFFEFLSGGSGSSGNGFISSIGSAIGGLFGFADGGYIPGNKMAVVGEEGPELFMPAGSGTIVPNFANGGGGGGMTSVTYNINAVDAKSFRQLVAADPEFIYNVTLAGSRRVPQ